MSSLTADSLIQEGPLFRADQQQDVIYKLVLARSERSSVLRELRDYILNAFTLFGSDESLMTALSQREEPDTQVAAQYMIFKLGVS